MKYLDATHIRALAKSLDVRPSKGRGQNFLFDANTVRRIVGLAEVGPADTVLEIGPGLGSLTAGLLHSGARVVAVEIEPALAEQLPVTMGELAPDAVGNLTVLQQDALRMGPDDLAPSAGTTDAPLPTVIVSNLPYNISVPVILHVLATFPMIARGLVMVQSEVADRLAAPPGSKVYGVPSAKLAWYASASRVGAVPATVFWPAPNVESGLVRFVRHDPPPADRRSVFALIDAAFSQRRKMLRSVLTSKYGPAARTALDLAGISPEARGETLSIDDFARLANAMGNLEEPRPSS